jgi:hypothetical protein
LEFLPTAEDSVVIVRHSSADVARAKIIADHRPIISMWRAAENKAESEIVHDDSAI